MTYSPAAHTFSPVTIGAIDADAAEVRTFGGYWWWRIHEGVSLS